MPNKLNDALNRLINSDLSIRLFIQAVDKINIPEVINFIRNGVNINNLYIGDKPLLEYSAWKTPVFIDAFVAAGADIHARNKNDNATILHVAANNGYLEELKFFIIEGLSVNEPMINGNTPLHHAVARNHTECVKELLNSGADPEKRNDDGQTPFEFALSLNKLNQSDYDNLNLLITSHIEQKTLDKTIEETNKNEQHMEF